MPKNGFSVLLLPAFFAVLLFSGCRSVPVQIVDLSGPDSLRINETGTFSVETNTDAKPPVTYRWQTGGDESVGTSQLSRSFSEEGRYTVLVEVANRKGKSVDTRSTTVDVYRPLIAPDIVVLTANPTRGDTQTPITFRATINGDGPFTYNWTLGDGTTSDFSEVTHTFRRAGTYTVGLQVTGPAGSAQRNITVEVARFEAPYCRQLTEMSPVFFDRNSSTLSTIAEATLQENVSILLECSDLSIEVRGYAAPGERNAQALSSDRARALEQFYISNGLAASRVTASGFGRVTGVTSKEGASQYRRSDTIPRR